MSEKARKVLAAASGGDHWVQLKRVMRASDDCDVAFITINEAYRGDIARGDVYIVNDATRWNPDGVLFLLVRIFRITFRERPDVVIYTGAASACVVIVLGHCPGNRTIWPDSIINVQRPSMSGTPVRSFAHPWLTQWAPLTHEGGPQCERKASWSS